MIHQKLKLRKEYIIIKKEIIVIMNKVVNSLYKIILKNNKNKIHKSII